MNTRGYVGMRAADHFEVSEPLFLHGTKIPKDLHLVLFIRAKIIKKFVTIVLFHVQVDSPLGKICSQSCP